jgi:integrase
MKLTASAIDSLTCPPGKRDVTYFDDSLAGFGLRCRSSGVRRYVVQFEIHGLTRRITLGAPEVVGLEQARRIARTHLAKKALGQDPTVEKAQARRAVRQTLRSVAERYLDDRRTKVRPSTMRELERYLLKWWKPLHSLPLNKITRADVAAHLGGPPVAAGQARRALSAFFAWSIRQGVIDSNPVVGTAIPDKHIGPRDRVLTLDEIFVIWKACDRDCAYDTIVRLIIATGARRQEIGSMRWAELNRAEGTWTIAADRAKSGRAHAMPVPPLFWSILDGWAPRAFPDYLFSRSDGFQSWSPGKHSLDARCAVAGWRHHDLRRSVATCMADLGVSPHVIEHVLSHAVGSRVSRIYNRSHYASDVRLALAQWADALQTAVDGGERKVISLRH